MWYDNSKLFLVPPSSMSPDAVARDLSIPTANEQPRYHVLSNKWHDSLILTNWFVRSGLIRISLAAKDYVKS